MKQDNFTDVPFTHRNLDRYVMRKSILRAISNTLPVLRGKLLDTGCGKMPYKKYILGNSNVKSYIGLDIESAKIYDAQIKPDYTWDGRTMPFADEEFDSAFATEVLEHCPDPELFMREVHRVLKPGGVFFFTVPFLWNLHEVPHDEYRYTPFALDRHFKNCNFLDIHIQATGGWHASLAQLMGLWVRRAPMNRLLRTLLSVFFMPVILLLSRLDARRSIQFKEGAMITGLYGTVKKA